MLTLPNSSLRIPGRLLVTEPTGAPGAWKGLPSTIELTREVEVFRIDAARLGLAGEWFALGEWIERVGAPPQAANLQRPIAYDARVTLEPGTVLNVGVCDPALGDAAAALHAELVRGPVSRTRPLDGWWGGESPG